MAFTVPEVLADLPALLNLVNKIAAGVEALPDPPAAVSAKAYADLVASVLPDLGALIDVIRAQAAD
jgi:hypothetical protein